MVLKSDQLQTGSQLQPGDLFTGKLVHLRAPRPDDKDVIARWTSDAEYQRMLSDDPARPRSASYFEEDKDKKKEHEHNEFNFRVRTIEDDKLIGFSDLWVNWSHQNCWLGIAIGDPDYRNRGYGTDTLRLTLNYAFRELNMYKVTLSVFGYNIRARHVYEKSGFVLEGTQRESMFRDGQRHDIHIMGILRPEWEQVHGSWF